MNCNQGTLLELSRVKVQNVHNNGRNENIFKHKAEGLRIPARIHQKIQKRKRYHGISY